MKGYKGFNSDMTCRDKQYAENTVFEEEKAEICQSGMHFCPNPLDVLDYYPLLNENAEMNSFAEVEAFDDVKTNDSKKYCTTKLKIGAKLNLSQFIKASIDFVFENVKSDISDGSKKDKSDYAQLASSGYNAKLASSGNNAKLASSGDNAKLASSGYYAQLASSGDNAKLASSGNNAKLASSGYYAQLVSSGDYAQLASSGDYAQLASSGYYAQLASSGNNAKLASSGDYSVVCGIGINNIAKASKDSWITLAEWKMIDEILKPVCVKTEYVDGEKIKANVFYKLENGEFVEV